MTVAEKKLEQSRDNFYKLYDFWYGVAKRNQARWQEAKAATQHWKDRAEAVSRERERALSDRDQWQRNALSLWSGEHTQRNRAIEAEARIERLQTGLVKAAEAVQEECGGLGAAEETLRELGFPDLVARLNREDQ